MRHGPALSSSGGSSPSRGRPRAALYAIAGVGLALSRTRIRGRCAYVGFWIYAWTTALVKYGCLSAASFDIEGTSDACA
ncbi:MAG: hypothetical protein U0166_19935 [Acidobacteriota bacterium]